MEEKREIWSLLSVLGSAIAAAIIFAAFMIHYYGPSGEYKVKNILLSPETTEKLDFHDGSEGGRFRFDHAEFRYYDDETKSWKKIVLDAQAYKTVYHLLENESSIGDVQPEVIAEFNLPNPATMTLLVRNEKVVRVFQEVVFVKDGDYYRVMLRGSDPIGNWAYFKQRKIYDHVFHALIPAESK